MGDGVRCHRSQGFLPDRAWPGRATNDPPRNPARMARLAGNAASRGGLRHTVPDGNFTRDRTYRGSDAGVARRVGLAFGGTQSSHARRRGGTPLRRLFDRPGPGRPCRRNKRADRADAEGDLAGPRWWRTVVDRRAEPARYLGPPRPHAIRIRPALHDVSVIAAAAR